MSNTISHGFFSQYAYAPCSVLLVAWGKSYCKLPVWPATFRERPPSSDPPPLYRIYGKPGMQPLTMTHGTNSRFKFKKRFFAWLCARSNSQLRSSHGTGRPHTLDVKEIWSRFLTQTLYKSIVSLTVHFQFAICCHCFRIFFRIPFLMTLAGFGSRSRSFTMT